MKALLMLEDGWYCECKSFTGEGEAFGELVFNTSLTGYQEIITDPSYQGQIVMMTATMIGNYGIRHEEDGSLKIHTKGFVVKEYSGEDVNKKKAESLEFCKTPPRYVKIGDNQDKSFYHSSVLTSLSNYLHSQNIPGSKCSNSLRNTI